MSSDALKQIFTAARPLVEQWIDTTRNLNLLFMRAWRAGEIDEAWAEFRKECPDLWLTYYIRARGLGDIKIGKSNQVRARVRSLFSCASRGIDLIACYPAPCAHEGELKEEFANLRLCGEWFRPGDELLTHLSLIGCDVEAFSNVVPAHYFRRFPERLQ